MPSSAFSIGAAWSALRVLLRDRQPVLWLYALIVGAASGCAAIAFWMGLSALQRLAFGAPEAMLTSQISALDWRVVLAAPVLGGIVVAAILHVFSDDSRPESVSHVIEASRLRHGAVNVRRGVVSAAASLASLGFGASAGREGPVVHLGATIATVCARALTLTPVESRTLTGCAVAAAVAASFNAPLAGALFALEVIIGHYAVRAFAPIVVASAAGTVASRIFVGPDAAFQTPDVALASFLELPAFALLGLVAAFVATGVMAAIVGATELVDKVQNRFSLPAWIEPPIAGLLLGLLAVFVPQVLGVGYEATSIALNGGYGLTTLLIIMAAKALATAITLAGRFGGGVFSPSLMIGAMAGGAFGLIAGQIAPDLASAPSLYALAGMGAVAAAVLGAPISTILIVFELTGDYEASIAVMVSTSLATVVTQDLIERSYFHWRLSQKDLHLGDGPQRYLQETILVGEVMRPYGAESAGSIREAQALAAQDVWLAEDSKLSMALKMFDTDGAPPFLPVIRRESEEDGEGGDSEKIGETGRQALVGAIYHIDALRAFNRALVEAHEEEHG